MITKFKTQLAIGSLLIAGVSVANARLGTQPEASLVRGNAQVKQADGSWLDKSGFVAGDVIRSKESGTTIKVPGATVRMDSGVSVKYYPSKSVKDPLNLTATGGRVHVRLDDSVALDLKTGNSEVRASKGEFIVDTDSGKVFVVEGDVKAQVADNALVASWEREPVVAAEGPDTRVRNTEKRTFTQGEESKGTRVGEDEAPPSSSPTPPPERNSYTPSPSPTPSASPTTPPRQSNPSASGGGSDWPWYVGGALAAGAGIYFLTRDDDNNDNPVFFNRVNFPTSP